MIVLGIETSCDETGVAIVEGKNTGAKILSNIVATSMSLHSKTGGIIPEIAAREQIKYILPVLDQALREARISHEQIEAIAVTVGPGLIGSLLVGVETARTLSYIWNKPLIPVNHLFGHIYANWLTDNPNIIFPALALIVSGGHTDLVLIKNHKDVQWIAGTRDDAAGEAFDKIGRLLKLPYPAGPTIERLAKNGNPKAYNLPRPLLHEDTFDFSFSGLKTAALRIVEKTNDINQQVVSDLSRCVQDAISDVLVKKTLAAAEKYNVRTILLSGGVAANQSLRDEFEKNISKRQLPIIFQTPPKNLCTDNGAMIAGAGIFNTTFVSWGSLSANPELYFD